MCLYHFAKDFAGPIATVIASIVAGCFAVTIALSQRAIARQQAQTSLDQLRLNLFERRYAIYVETEKFIDEVESRDLPEFDKIRNEARFFFPEKQNKWVRALEEEIADFLVLKATSQDAGEKLKARAKLINRRHELPDVFASELDFSHVSRPRK